MFNYLYDKSESWDDEVEINGKTFNLDMRFHNVLYSLSMLSDKNLKEYEKPFKFLMNIFKDFTIDDFQLITEQDLFIVIEHILNYLIEDREQQTDDKKVFDLVQDWKYIDASFLSEYGIDLYKDKIHWFLFINRLNCLSKNNKLKEVIEIRTMDIPKPDKYNRKQIEAIKKAKSVYALKSNISDIDEKTYKNNIDIKAKNLFNAMR